MELYKNDIKELIQRDYSPTDNGIQEIYMSTEQIFNQVLGVIPRHPITEHDVYEIMKEMQFEIKVISVFKKDKENKPTKELDYQIYRWVLYPKPDWV